MLIGILQTMHVHSLGNAIINYIHIFNQYHLLARGVGKSICVSVMALCCGVFSQFTPWTVGSCLLITLQVLRGHRLWTIHLVNNFIVFLFEEKSLLFMVMLCVTVAFVY